MGHSKVARWMAVSLLFLGRLSGHACQRDESLPATWPLAARSGGASSWTSPLAPTAVAAPLVGAEQAAVTSVTATPALTFTRHDLDSSPFGQVTEGINVGDIDGDGRPDLVVGGDQYLLWYHNPDWAPHLIARIKEITDKPVTRIINTHTHYDHTEGNPDFPATVEVVTHENTAKMMPEMKAPYGITLTDRNVFKDSNGRGLPKRTFKDEMTIGSGSDRIELRYFGRAHTSGDAFVIFPALRTMHTGDTFPNKGMPIMDINNGGSGVAYAETLARAAKVPNIDTVITGHNQTVLTSADIQTYSEFIRDFVAAVRAAKKAGQSIDDVANSWKLPEKYQQAGYQQPQAARIKPNVEVLWKELN